jgi:hypothetical protein
VRGLLSDCRHALRLYRRTPGASLIAVFVLAIGMAFVGAFLSLYVDLILRPHPGFEQSAELATAGFSGGPQALGLPPAMTERMTEEVSSIEAVASSFPLVVMLGTDREAASAELVSAQFFAGLRPRLALGRGFLPAEQAPDSEPVVVISNRLWQTRFSGDPGILGTVVEVTRDPSQTYYNAQTIQTDRGPGTFLRPSAPERETTFFRIVGVMARTLPGLAASETDLWLPQQLGVSLYVGTGDMRLALLSAQTFVRRSAGVSATAVQSEMESRYAADPIIVSPLPGTRLDVIDGIVRDFGVHREAERQLQLFLGGSVLLALVAGANMSLFLLARAPGRRRELGIRLAVGAPVRRVARQLVTEAGLLVLASAILGLVASVWLGMYLRGLALLRDAEWREVTLLDWRVLGFAVAFMLALSLLVALAPVVGLKRAGIAASSREVAGRASPVQRLAGTAQLAVAGALGAAAIAFAWHLGALMFGDPGYELTDRYVAEFRRPADSPGATSDVRRLEIPQRREVMESIPGVTAVSFGRPVPAVDLNSFAGLNIPRSDNSSTTIEAVTGNVDGRFVEVLGLRLAHGRALGDDEEAVMVNQALARAVFGRENVVGEHLPEGDNLRGYGGQEIVGVLEDMSYGHPAGAIGPIVFGRSGAFSEGPLVIESGLTAAALQRELDRLTESGSLDIVLSNIRPLHQPRADQLAPDRARTSLTIATAALVVLLAAFGYYGTQRYLVAAGRREYAIRASLGAGPRALGKLVVSRGLLMSLPGLVLGGMLAFIAVAWLRSDFLGDEVSPAVVTVAVVAGLALLLLAATLGPAGEARRTQPAPLLRED